MPTSIVEISEGVVQVTVPVEGMTCASWLEARKQAGEIIRALLGLQEKTDRWLAAMLKSISHSNR